MSERMKESKIIFAILVMILASCNGRKPEPFDESKWLEALPEQRDLMADDLIMNHLADGMSKEDVIKLLGKPDNIYTEEFDGGGNKLTGSMTYSWHLGSGYHRIPPTAKRGWDSMFIYIHFSDNSKVIKIEFQGF